MTANQSPHRRRHTPLNDGPTAYRVAALPPEYGYTKLAQLFERGYTYWTVDGQARPDDLVTDVGRFGTRAFREHVRTRTLEDPVIADPGALAVLATLSALCVKAHPKFERVPPAKLQLAQNIGECYVNTILGYCRNGRQENTEEGDTVVGDSPSQHLAELLYAKPESEESPHPGRVCTGVKRLPELGDGFYIEIPMPAASNVCFVRATDDYDDVTNTPTGEITTHVANNNLYIPVADLERKYREAGPSIFDALLKAQERAISEDQLRWLTDHEEAIGDRIDRFLHSNHHHRLWTDWHNGERLVRAVRSAIRTVPDEAVRLGEFYPASRLYAAIDEVEPRQKSTRSTLARITSAAQLANLLNSLQNHPHIAVREEEMNSDSRFTYQLTDSNSSSRRLAVEEIEDLFELPCMANMDEHLTEKGPVRKDLYNFVRTVMWLPQYQDAAFETVLADLKDVFARWPWYDEQITEYQVRYEFDNDIDGETPLPMNCDNEDMQRYCIGQDICPYSIWGSLPFPDEMYQQVKETDGFDYSVDGFEY